MSAVKRNRTTSATHEDAIERHLLQITEARNTLEGAQAQRVWIPLALVLAIYGRMWVLGQHISPAYEFGIFVSAAVVYLLCEIRCEVLRASIRTLIVTKPIAG